MKGATTGPGFGPLRLAPQLLILQAMLRSVSVACTIAAVLAANASPARAQDTVMEFPARLPLRAVVVPIPKRHQRFPLRPCSLFWWASR